MEFKKPDLEDKALINAYLKKQYTRCCEYTFSNIYLWNRHHGIVYAVIEDMLVFRTESEPPSFTFPAGAINNLKGTVDALDAYGRANGWSMRMHNVTTAQFAQLEEAYPGRFTIVYNRDAADYIYEVQKLATLSGKKYHGKRNHINKFTETYPDWSYEVLSDDNIEDCFQMGLKWRTESGCDDDPEKNREMCVSLNALRLYKELDLRGGLLRVNGEAAAFTLGCPVSSDTFVVHVEKALNELPGAYPLINREFVLHEMMDYTYVNREEDMGMEGLRKAKLSYRPVELIEKGIVTEKK